MTLVGKIFTVLIFVMSICFMTASVMVFATHKNWKDYATATTAAAGKPVGLETQLKDLRLLETGLKEELERLKKRLEEERVARRAVLGSLTARLVKAESELLVKQREYETVVAALNTATETAKLAQSRLSTLEAEIALTRGKLRDTEQDLDDKFNKVVTLQDELNQANNLKSNLGERNNQFAQQITRMKLVMDYHGLDEMSPVRHIAPRVTGVVLAINNSDLIEVSIGSDDGLKPGHVLQVYRGNQYLGQITIRTTGPDRAVGQIDKTLQRGKIQKGDNVTTKLI
ncbi:hypothetical protein [Anatilimnocola floriformis]|uniref:hypothetical protein n=1 Tax=Anatilimnocola floriformis TaxID=2948575 RepID=UPI0020C242F5|nr:hypothetical protein [Anatilimnocola floriformis]